MNIHFEANYGDCGEVCARQSEGRPSACPTVLLEFCLRICRLVRLMLSLLLAVLLFLDNRDGLLLEPLSWLS